MEKSIGMNIISRKNNREHSYEEFINHCDDNNENIVKIYTCVSGNRRLDNNGNIVENNYPELYGY